MIKRDYMVLVIAIVCGIGAFLLVSNFLREAAQPKREFVIAGKAIPKDSMIGRRDVKLSKPMKKISPEDLFLQIDDVIGNQVLEEIPQGALIRRSKVERQTPDSTAPLKDSLPIRMGMKGLTISSSEADHMPDLVEIGGYVDLIGRVLNYEGKIETRTLLRGVQVVGLERSKDLEIKSITVTLSPQEAEAALDALSRGKVRLVVSSEGGEKPTYQPSWGTIEIIRGVGKETKVAFGKTAESPEEKSHQ